MLYTQYIYAVRMINKFEFLNVGTSDQNTHLAVSEQGHPLANVKISGFLQYRTNILFTFRNIVETICTLLTI